MAKYQLQFNVANATLLIGFDSPQELEQRIKELDLSNLEQMIGTALKSVVRAKPRDVKPALAGICKFRDDGVLEFLKPAPSKVEAMGVVLYAHDPDSVDSQTLGTLAAEKNPAAYLGAKGYAKYFQKTGTGLYRLSQDGKVWVASTVIPKIGKE